MIALLIVSHSARLAHGVVELVRQMAPGVPLFAAGGTAEGGIGTSFERVLDGFHRGLEHDGVIALTDLGSAVMVAETALDFLDEADQARVRLSDAPLLEGAIVAAVAAASGADLDSVLAATSEAGLKGNYDGPTSVRNSVGTTLIPVEEGTVRRTVTLLNPDGLHARPAAQLVRTVSAYQAEVLVSNLDRPGAAATASSLLSLLRLGATQGHRLVVSARGPEAGEALNAVEALVASSFDMSPDPFKEPAVPDLQQPEDPGEGDGVRGIPASPGSATGRAVRLEALLPAIPDTKITDPVAENGVLTDAIERAGQELASLIAASDGESPEHSILQAHHLLLNDPLLARTARERIAGARENAARAWNTVIEQQAAELRKIEDPIAAGRAADLLDVGQRVLRHLLGWQAPEQDLTGAIVLANDLPPSELTTLVRMGVVGIALEEGTATAHVAILARALGLPMMIGAGAHLRAVAPGTQVILDGTHGLVNPSPTEQAVAAAREEAATRDADLRRLLEHAHEPARTRDGVIIQVEANISSLEDARAAVANGADGVGLFRTEFLYTERPTLPEEEEQVRAFRAIFEALGKLPVVVRTLDIGGDKPAPALALDPGLNSAMGIRGLRLTLQRTDLFRQHLRAILRAASGRHINLMFPMVTTSEEIEQARTLLREVEQSLNEQRLARGYLEKVGIMIEVPAAAITADLLAPAADFFSVGSNDLVQYTMAADRTNRQVASLYSSQHPSILRLIAQVVEHAHTCNRTVGICGEIAGDPDLIPLLVGLGIRKLSMAPSLIPRAKATIRTLKVEEARASARNALLLS